METEKNTKAQAPARIVAILNEKGGVGKTTTTISVGASMAARGLKVLLVDLDPQSSLSMAFGIEDIDGTIYDALLDPNAKVTRLQIREGLHIIPSDITMSSADVTLAAKFAREKCLKQFLERYRTKYDYILLDCPPNLGVLAVNALVACDDLLVPVCAETHDVRGLKVLQKMLGIMSSVKKTDITGIIVTRYDGRKTINRDLEMGLRLEYGEKVFKTLIRENTDISKAPTFKKTIFEYAPASHTAKDYEALTTEIIERLQNK